MSVTDTKHFHDEDAARAYLEAVRWPEGPVCPHCGSVGGAYSTKRAGLYRCAAKECRKDFTVTIGTLFERSHIPLHKWLFATHLMMSSKKGISAHQLHRMLSIGYKSAWFMCHRIRESLRDNNPTTQLGGANKVVEADETYVGGKAKNMHASKRPHNGRGAVNKEAVFSLVERDGRVRSHHVATVTAKSLKPILEAQIDARTHIMTDESSVYPNATKLFAGHSTVNHGIEEYVRGGFFHTNTVEGYFSVFKRGIIGTYHHVSAAHLKRYLAEFDFRYNERSALGINDADRTYKALRGIEGKRLTYGGSAARPN